MSAAMSADFSPFRTNSPLTVVKLTGRGLNLPLLEKRYTFGDLRNLNRDDLSPNSSIPRVDSLYLEVRHLEELLVFSIHEENAAPVYTHHKRTSAQRWSCNTDVSEATVGPT